MFQTTILIRLSGVPESLRHLDAAETCGVRGDQSSVRQHLSPQSKGMFGRGRKSPFEANIYLRNNSITWILLPLLYR